MRKPRIQWRHVAPIALSIVAVAVSAVGLYIQSLYGTANLSLQLTGFGIQKHGNDVECTVEAALFNSGNRDTALLRVGLSQGRTGVGRNGATTTTYAEYFADANPPGYVDTVVKGGDIRLLTFVFPGCKVGAIESNVRKGGLNQFSLVTDAVNYDGARSNVSTTFATASIPANGNLAFAMHLGGQFDLLRDGAHFEGKPSGPSETMSIDNDGRTSTSIHSSH